MRKTCAFPVLIHDFATDGGDYIANSPEECRDSTDRNAYEMAVMLNDSVKVGSVIAVPSTCPDFASLSRDT